MLVVEMPCDEKANCAESRIRNNPAASRNLSKFCNHFGASGICSPLARAKAARHIVIMSAFSVSLPARSLVCWHLDSMANGNASISASASMQALQVACGASSLPNTNRVMACSPQSVHIFVLLARPLSGSSRWVVGILRGLLFLPARRPLRQLDHIRIADRAGFQMRSNGVPQFVDGLRRIHCSHHA